MSNENIVMIFYHHKRNYSVDIEVPLNITVNDLINSINYAFHLNIDTSDLSKCYLKTENPIAFLQGNRLLYEYNLRNGTIIQYTQ